MNVFVSEIHEMLKYQRDKLLVSLEELIDVAQSQGADRDEGSALFEARAVIAEVKYQVELFAITRGNHEEGL